jgi:N-acetyl-anhydromuramyl-L-alanine amidase AmpD
MKFTTKDITQLFPNLKEYPKDRIMLINSLMTEEDYFDRLNLQREMLYPHFFINRKGETTQHVDTCYSNKITGINKIDNYNITICLENLGWLKEIDNDTYENWYKKLVPAEDVFRKKYMDQTLWHSYTKEQYSSLRELLKELLPKHKIKTECVSHIFPVDNIEIYEGVFCRANIGLQHTDPSPAFSFNEIKKVIK